VGAQVTVIHAPCGDHRQDDVHDTLQRVVAQEWSAGFEVAGEFGTLKVGGFWSGHTPKTPPFVVPLRDRSHVQEFPVQHSLNLKLSGTELLGRPAEALAFYHEGAERLRTKFRTAPLPETQALARDIERRTALPPAAHTGTTPKSPLMNPTLVGREEQWARMEAAWAAGRGIVLSGPPGVGKTRLALDFLDAHGGGMRFQGRLGDAGLPYATHARTYRQVLEAYPHLNLDGAHLQELARILPHLGAPPAPIRDENEKFRFWQAKVQALQAAIAQGLRHMVFDDVQHMDDASIEAGGFVFAQLGWGDPAAPYRTIHIFRQGELSLFQQGLLDAMTAAGLVDLIEVGPLDEAATAQLVGQLQLPHRSGLAADLARYTGGNPLLFLEAARSLREAGDLPRLGGALPLPESAAQVTASRLARLSPAALQVARAAAVLGSDFGLEPVAQVLGMPLLETAGAWEELEAAQVMRGSQFEHDLVAEVLLSSLSGAVRRLLHRTAARTLASGAAAPGRVARHWEAGATPGKPPHGSNGRLRTLGLPTAQPRRWRMERRRRPPMKPPANLSSPEQYASGWPGEARPCDGTPVDQEVHRIHKHEAERDAQPGDTSGSRNGVCGDRWDRWTGEPQEADVISAINCWAATRHDVRSASLQHTPHVQRTQTPPRALKWMQHTPSSRSMKP
jgi:hypothetical protein